MAKLLRDYQSAALDALNLYWRTGGGNGPLLAGLTALGLGVLAVALARRGPISPRRR
jgi:hypothetical protein